MASTSNPKVSISILPAQTVVPIAGRNDLILGTITTGPLAVSDQLYLDVFNTYTESQLTSLFGANTDVRNRMTQFQNANGGYSTLDVKVLSQEGGATEAAGGIDIGTDGAGVATEAGSYTVTIVDEFQFSVTIPVAIGDTDLTVAAAIVAAFSATAFPTMPVLVAIDGTNAWETDITAIDGGTIGNVYRLKVEGGATGLGATVITQLTGGATNPSLATIFDNVQSTRFTGINWPTAWMDDIDVVRIFLDDRFNSDNTILDGVAFAGEQDTFANAKSDAEALNSQSLCIGGTTASVLQPPDWTFAYFQGVRAKRLSTGAPISQNIVSTAGLLDNFGGISLASLPYFNTPLSEMSVVDPNVLYTQLEQEELEDAGFTVFGTNRAENGMLMGPCVTTNTTDAAGNLNGSFHYLNYVDTGSVCREYMFNNLKSRFSQSRLTSGTLVAGRSMENEESITAEIFKIYVDLSDLALTVKGAVAEEFFLLNLTVTLDIANRSVSASMQLPIVTQLGEMIMPVQLNFSVEGA